MPLGCLRRVSKRVLEGREAWQRLRAVQDATPPFPYRLASPARSHPVNETARVCRDGTAPWSLCAVTARCPAAIPPGTAT
jgi:hypothetical protein